jgi:L-seryl-tRNA(Ser) seleniumtransferase
MRVHPSNYRVVGFTSSPRLDELAALAREAMIPLYEDAGSGQLSDLSELGVEGEPIIEQLIAGGADLVSFSGDKLLGSVQAGLIVGKRGIVDRLRRHPLYRALRSDKLRLAALEATLAAHQRNRAEVPVLQMLSLTKQDISTRAQSLLSQVSNNSKTVHLDLIDSESAIGGGAGPTANLPTTVIAVSDQNRTAQEIETVLRTSLPPVIARIADQKVLLDLRTVFPDQEDSLLRTLNNL